MRLRFGGELSVGTAAMARRRRLAPRTRALAAAAGDVQAFIREHFPGSQIRMNDEHFVIRA